MGGGVSVPRVDGSLSSAIFLCRAVAGPSPKFDDVAHARAFRAKVLSQLCQMLRRTATALSSSSADGNGDEEVEMLADVLSSEAFCNRMGRLARDASTDGLVPPRRHDDVGISSEQEGRSVFADDAPLETLLLRCCLGFASPPWSWLVKHPLGRARRGRSGGDCGTQSQNARNDVKADPLTAARSAPDDRCLCCCGLIGSAVDIFVSRLQASHHQEDDVVYRSSSSPSSLRRETECRMVMEFLDLLCAALQAMVADAMLRSTSTGVVGSAASLLVLTTLTDSFRRAVEVSSDYFLRAAFLARRPQVLERIGQVLCEAASCAFRLNDVSAMRNVVLIASFVLRSGTDLVSVCEVVGSALATASVICAAAATPGPGTRTTSSSSPVATDAFNVLRLLVKLIAGAPYISVEVTAQLTAGLMSLGEAYPELLWDARGGGRDNCRQLLPTVAAVCRLARDAPSESVSAMHRAAGLLRLLVVPLGKLAVAARGGAEIEATISSARELLITAVSVAAAKDRSALRNGVASSRRCTSSSSSSCVRLLLDVACKTMDLFDTHAFDEVDDVSMSLLPLILDINTCQTLLSLLDALVQPMVAPSNETVLASSPSLTALPDSGDFVSSGAAEAERSDGGDPCLRLLHYALVRASPSTSPPVAANATTTDSLSKESQTSTLPSVVTTSLVQYVLSVMASADASVDASTTGSTLCHDYPNILRGCELLRAVELRRPGVVSCSVSALREGRRGIPSRHAGSIIGAVARAICRVGTTMGTPASEENALLRVVDGTVLCQGLFQVLSLPEAIDAATRAMAEDDATTTILDQRVLRDEGLRLPHLLPQFVLRVGGLCHQATTFIDLHTIGAVAMDDVVTHVSNVVIAASSLVLLNSMCGRRVLLGSADEEAAVGSTNSGADLAEMLLWFISDCATSPTGFVSSAKALLQLHLVSSGGVSSSERESRW